MSNRVKYFQFPSFEAADWVTRNPVLRKGEIGVEVDNTGKPRKMKMGDGSTTWNNLDYMEFSYWADTTPVVNPIGDASGNLSGLSDREILELMLNPYQAPAFSNLQNNANGQYNSVNTIEIGASLNGTISVQYNLSNQANLVGATPINITASGIFSNEGNFAVGTTGMTLVSPLSPSSIQTYTITLVATHTKGTVQGTTSFRFYPRIIWGTTPTTAAPNWSSPSFYNNGGYVISNDFTRDYGFQSGGYLWLAIPSMLTPSNLTFTDVTDPNAPAGFGFQFISQQSINNGVTTYNYDVYRSTYNILQNNSVLRVS